MMHCNILKIHMHDAANIGISVTRCHGGHNNRRNSDAKAIFSMLMCVIHADTHTLTIRYSLDDALIFLSRLNLDDGNNRDIFLWQVPNRYCWESDDITRNGMSFFLSVAAPEYLLCLAFARVYLLTSILRSRQTVCVLL
jgi:hypothetical protein